MHGMYVNTLYNTHSFSPSCCFNYKLLSFQLLPHIRNVLHLAENNAGPDGSVVFSYKRRQVLNLVQLSVIA